MGGLRGGERASEGPGRQLCHHSDQAPRGILTALAVRTWKAGSVFISLSSCSVWLAWANPEEGYPAAGR